jgi:polyhydroxyalkanoate synthesis regulator phasin
MTASRLQRAYDSARRWLREDLPAAEREAAENLLELMGKVREYLVAAEDLTREEAQQVVDTLRYDLREAAHHWHELELEYLDWARFDVDRLEQVVLDKLLAAADPTWVELARFQAGRQRLAEDNP